MGRFLFLLFPIFLCIFASDVFPTTSSDDQASQSWSLIDKGSAGYLSKKDFLDLTGKFSKNATLKVLCVPKKALGQNCMPDRGVREVLPEILFGQRLVVLQATKKYRFFVRDSMELSEETLGSFGNRFNHFQDAVGRWYIPLREAKELFKVDEAVQENPTADVRVHLQSGRSVEAKRVYVFVSERDLLDNKEWLAHFFQHYPNSSLVLNVGDEFVEKRGLIVRTIQKYCPPWVCDKVILGRPQGGLLLSKEHLPASLKHLVIANVQENVQSIGDGFLKENSLVSLDLNALTHVRGIGDHFLFESNALKVLKFETSSNVESIGTHFLARCSALGSLKLGVMPKVEFLEESFLSGCGALTHIDLSIFPNVEVIGDYFLLGAGSLRSLNLSSLRGVESIGVHFLAGCRSLQFLDLTPLSHVDEIGREFLSKCDGLQGLQETIKKAGGPEEYMEQLKEQEPLKDRLRRKARRLLRYLKYKNYHW